MDFTCPMRPEVRNEGPGSCPKCGMDLEPLTASAEPEGNSELASMKRRFWAGLALTLPVFIIAMSHMAAHSRGLDLLQMILSTPVVLWAGWPLLERGRCSIVHRHLNMFTLISIGILTAYAYSAAAVILGKGAVYFE